MAGNRKYYYLKLKENYFDEDAIVLLESMQDGILYNVIDSRYRSGRPLIVTTNLSLTEIQHPQDTPHARIYDRLLAMCAPVCFTGENFRRATAQGKLERLKAMMNTGKESL